MAQHLPGHGWPPFIMIIIKSINLYGDHAVSLPFDIWTDFTTALMYSIAIFISSIALIILTYLIQLK